MYLSKALSKILFMKKNAKTRRKNRVRARLTGTAARPRVSVFRSNSDISVQFIDDSVGKTLMAYEMSKVKAKAESKVELARIMGKEVATAAKKKKIDKIVFDRSGCKYHGKVKALADGMREGGLDF